MKQAIVVGSSNQVAKKMKHKSKVRSKLVHSKRNQLQQQTLQEMENIDPVILQQRRYTVRHSALARLNSGIDDNPAAAVEIATPVSLDYVKAAKLQYVTRKFLSNLGQATADEVMEAEMRKHSVAVETYRSIPLPNAAVQLAQLITNLSLRMEERFDAIDRRFDDIDRRLDGLAIQGAKHSNRICQLGEMWTPVPNNRGELPRQDLFPANHEALNRMIERDVDELLAFYGIGQQARGGGRGRLLQQKKQSLLTHLGFLVVPPTHVG